MIYALIAIISILVAAQLVLRTNSAVVFLAVCAGSVLLSAAGKDTDLLAHSVGSGTRVSSNVVQAVLILLPGIASAIILRKRIAKHKLMFALVPAFCAAIVGLSLVYPFLSSTFQSTLTSSKGWSLLAQYYEVIVVIGIISSMTTLAFTMPKHGKDEKHKRGRH